MTNKEKHIPQGYKDSPLGIIPKEWEVKRLGDICDYVDYRGKSPNKSSKGIFLVTAKNIREGYIDYEVSQEFIPIDEFEDTMRRGKAQIGDVLITTEAPLGHVAQIDKSNIALAQRVIKYRAKNGLLNTYLKYYLMSEKFQTILTANATGSTALGIKGSRLHQLPIAFPCIVEQKKILNILNLWDTAIEKQSELIEKLKLRKRALMQQLLTGKKRLPGFSGEWKEVKLGDVFDERNETNRDDLPLLSITGDKGVIYQSDSDKRDISNDDKSKYKRICPNDIGYNTMRMWQGRSALSSIEGIVSPAYTIVTPHKNVDVRFMAMLIQQPRVVYDFWTHSQGLVSDTLNCKYPDFCQVKVRIPSKEEQTAIADLLYEFDKEINLANEKLANLQSQKRGLMQQLLTGKKRIKL